MCDDPVSECCVFVSPPHLFPFLVCVVCLCIVCIYV